VTKAQALAARGATPAAARRALPFLLPWGLMGALLAALYAPVLSALRELSRTEAAYSHGLLIPLIAAYMVWHKRGELRRVPRRPCAAAWPFLLCGLLLLVGGRLAFEIHAAALSLVIVLGALVAMAGGPALLRALAFPLAYLIFMIPLPWAFYFTAGDPLQTATAALAARSVAAMGVPLFREGTLIYMSAVTLEVEASCSGVRTALSLLPLAAAFAYLMVRRPGARAWMVASALPIAILVNILRVMAILIQAHLYPRWVTGYYLHLYTGWIPMLIGLPLLFAVGGLLQWRERRG